MADVTERMLALLTKLQTGRGVGGGDLAAKLGVSPRTLRRDVDRLRSYGYPVETRPGPGGYYRLGAGASLPPMVFDDDEALAVLLALATLGGSSTGAEGSVEEAASRAYGKIDQYLPRRLQHRAARMRASVETGTTFGPAAGVSAASLATIADGVRERRVAAFEYVDKSGERSRRRVEPHGQVYHLLRWYLLGWDQDRDDWRTFRIDRMTQLELSTRTFDPRPLPADSPLGIVRQHFVRDRTRVELTVHAPLATVADALEFQEARLSAVGAETTAAVLMVEDWRWLALTLAVLDVAVTIESPAHVREACREFADRLGRAAGRAPA